MMKKTFIISLLLLATSLPSLATNRIYVKDSTDNKQLITPLINNFPINISSLAKGCFFIRIEENGKLVFSSKFINL